MTSSGVALGCPFENLVDSSWVFDVTVIAYLHRAAAPCGSTVRFDDFVQFLVAIVIVDRIEAIAVIGTLDHDGVSLLHVAFKVPLDEPASNVRHKDIKCELH